MSLSITNVKSRSKAQPPKELGQDGAEVWRQSALPHRQFPPSFPFRCERREPFMGCLEVLEPHTSKVGFSGSESGNAVVTKRAGNAEKRIPAH